MGVYCPNFHTIILSTEPPLGVKHPIRLSLTVCYAILIQPVHHPPLIQTSTNAFTRERNKPISLKNQLKFTSQPILSKSNLKVLHFREEWHPLSHSTKIKRIQTITVQQLLYMNQAATSHGPLTPPPLTHYTSPLPTTPPNTSSPITLLQET